MSTFKRISHKASTQTVSVYTRHTKDCSKARDPQWKRSSCIKYLYPLRDGVNKTISTKTRSWASAEEQAQEIKDQWDPVKQKLRDLGELQKTQELGEMDIASALKRWLTTVKSDSDTNNEHTHSKYQTAAKQIQSWAEAHKLVRLCQITPDVLDTWKGTWSPKAEDPDNRIGKTTAGRRLEKIKGFLSYCVTMKWIAVSPATEMKAIKLDPSMTLPLLSGRYKRKRSPWSGVHLDLYIYLHRSLSKTLNPYYISRSF